jgi:transposase-like protein
LLSDEVARDTNAAAGKFVMLLLRMMVMVMAAYSMPVLLSSELHFAISQNPQRKRGAHPKGQRGQAAAGWGKWREFNAADKLV